MNRNLREVRRYWPRAKRSKSGARFWAAGKRANLTLVAEVWEVDFVSDAPLPSLKHIGATIAEAMRAAGFGVRPLGTMGRDPARVIVDRQRPCKGARLGRRKREAQP